MSHNDCTFVIPLNVVMLISHRVLASGEQNMQIAKLMRIAVAVSGTFTAPRNIVHPPLVASF